MFDLFSVATVMDIIIIMITCFQRNQGGQEHTSRKKKDLNINFVPSLVTKYN